VDPSAYTDDTYGAVRRAPGPGGYDFFVPAPVPRALTLEPSTTSLLSKADRALGRLAGAGRLLPNSHLLVQPYLTAEALSSSRIEGTQASLSDVFEAEADKGDSSTMDVREVQNYIRAFEHGLARLDELPLSLRLIREVHERLIKGVRGEERSPGEFRRSQNWIGAPGCTLDESVFTPPPDDPEMMESLGDWESFLHEGHDLPPLIACALIHYQFETIHPFLDGNGRLGRLIIVLYLTMIEELPEPLLYLSPYFEQRRDRYYALLQGVRQRGEMKQWLEFFLEAVATQTSSAVTLAEALLDLQSDYRQRLVDDRSRAAEIIDLLFVNPFVTTRRVTDELGVTNAGANNLLRRLESAEILRQSHVSGRGGRITWYATDVMRVLTQATDA